MSRVGKMAAAGFSLDAASNMYMGDDVGTSLAKAGVTGAIFASNPVLAPTLMMGSLAGEAYWGVQKFNMQKKSWWNAQYAYNNQVGGNYMDTQRAMTMRQAAVQAIQGSKLNARSALGGEAKIMNPYSYRR
ncbi:hypothetical protein IRB79_26660 (plasmid) [Cytobacillus oceanisediminis]|nr:hypothetical protein [Cytobacillus oceanisediminis]UOE58226.1 hypothetical protein IRB79_26660 [Cytobacillus oceanisediminis]